MALSGPQKSVLRSSNAEASAKAFSDLEKFIKKGRWIGSTNRYKEKTIERLVKDSKNNSLRQKDLMYYIAASAPAHYIDGWRFASQALSAHLHRQYDVARHVAYYAELRAGMSFLATQGVGIFSRKHFVVQSENNCQRIPKQSGTHQITWDALNHWTSLTRSRKLVDNFIKPFNVSLSDWLSSIGAASSSRALGSSWLKDWGLDIKNFSADRDSRNLVSYRPSLVGKEIGDGEFVRARLHEIWAGLEPSGGSGLDKVENELLRRSLERAYSAVHGRSPQGSDFRHRVVLAVDTIAPSGISSESLVSYLCRDTDTQTLPIFAHAESTSTSLDRNHHIEVICRAILLLYLASRACSSLFTQGGYDRSDFEFWWKAVGDQHGLWGAEGAPDYFTDLWADIEDALEELVDEGTAGLGYFDLLHSRSIDWSALLSSEKAGLWAIFR